MGWAKSHLSLGGGETTYDNVVIPYHGKAHWSLFMLEPSDNFHFDSKIGCMIIQCVTFLFDKYVWPCC
jgi:hypothetical protein